MPTSFLAFWAKLVAFLALCLGLPLLALPLFVFLPFFLLSFLSGLGFLLCLRYVLRLWNPRVDVTMRERAGSRLTGDLKRASASRDGEDGSSWADGWARGVGLDGLRQIRVHQYLEDQIKNLGWLDGATDPVLLCGWEDRMSLDGESVGAQEVFSKGMESSEANEEDDEDHRPGSKHKHVFCMK